MRNVLIGMRGLGREFGLGTFEDAIVMKAGVISSQECMHKLAT
jgi:hypothetical protein